MSRRRHEPLGGRIKCWITRPSHSAHDHLQPLLHHCLSMKSFCFKMVTRLCLWIPYIVTEQTQHPTGVDFLSTYWTEVQHGCAFSLHLAHHNVRKWLVALWLVRCSPLFTSHLVTLSLGHFTLDVKFTCRMPELVSQGHWKEMMTNQQ